MGLLLTCPLVYLGTSLFKEEEHFEKEKTYFWELTVESKTFAHFGLKTRMKFFFITFLTTNRAF